MEKSSTNETMVLTIKNLSKSKWSSLSKKKVEDKSCYSPRTEKLIDIISPILDYYGYNKEDVYNFISLYKFDIEKIQLELCNIMESREENDEGLWETVKSKKNKKPAEKNSKKNNFLQGNSGRKDNKQIGKIFPKGLRLKEKDPRKNKTTITGSSLAVGQYSNNKPFTSSNHKVTHFVSNGAKYENSSTLHEINKKIPEERGLKEKLDADKGARKLVNIKSLSAVAASAASASASATASATATTAAPASATAAGGADDGANRDAAKNSKGASKKKGTLKSEEEKKKGVNESYDEDFLNNNPLEERDPNKRKKNAIKEPDGVVNEEHFAKGRGEDNSNRKGNKSGYNNVGSSSVSNHHINSHYNQFDKKKYAKLEDGKAPPAAASTSAATGGGYKSSDEHSIKKDSKGKGAIGTTTTTNSGSGNQHSSNVGTNGLGTSAMATSASRYSNFNYHDKYFNKNYNRYSGKSINDSLIPRNAKQRFPPFSNKSTGVYSSAGNHSYFSSYAKGGLKQPPYLSKSSLRSKRNTSKNGSVDYDYENELYNGEKLAPDAGNDQSSSIYNENDHSVKKKGATEAAKKTGTDKATPSTSYASVVNSKMKQSPLAPPLEEAKAAEAKTAEAKRTGAMNTQIVPNNNTSVEEEKKEKKKNKCQLIPIKNNQPEKLWVSVITKGVATTSNNNANGQDVGEKVDPSGAKKNTLSSSKELKPESASQQGIKKAAEQSGKPEKQKKKGKGKEKEMESISSNVYPASSTANDTNLSSSINASYKSGDHVSKVRSKGEDQPDGEEPRIGKGAQLSYSKDGKNEAALGIKSNNKSSFPEVDASKAQPFVDQQAKMEKEKYANESSIASKKETSGAKKISETKLDTDDKKKKKKKRNDQDVVSTPNNDSTTSTRVKTPSASPSHEMKRGKGSKLGSKLSSNNNSSLNLTFSAEKLVSDDFSLSEGYDGKEKNSIPIYMPNLALMGNNTMNKKIFFGSINITGNQIENIDVMPDGKLEHIRSNGVNSGGSGAYGEASGRFGTQGGGFNNQGSTSYSHGVSSYNTHGTNYGSGANNNTTTNNSGNKMMHTDNRKKNNLRKNYGIDATPMGMNNDHMGSGNHNRSSAMHHKESDSRDYDHGHNDFRGSKEREFKHFDFKSRNHKREDNNDMLNENKHKSLFSSSNSKHAPHVHAKSQNLYLPKMTTTTSSSSSVVAATAATAASAAVASSSSNNHHHHMHNSSGNVGVNSGNQNAKHLLSSSSSVFMNQSPRTNGSQDNSSSALMTGKGSKYVQSSLKSKNYDHEADDAGSIQLNQISQKFLHGGSGGSGGSGGNGGNSGNTGNTGNIGSGNTGNTGSGNNLASPSSSANIAAGNTGASSTGVSNKNTNTDVSNINLMNMGMNNLSNNNMYNSYNSPPGLANQFNYSFTNLSYPYNNMHYNGYSTQTLVPQYGLINNHYTKNNSMHNNNFNYNMNYENFDESNLYGHNNNMHMNNYVNYMNVNVKKNQLNNLDDDNLSNSGEVSISGSLQQPQSLPHDNNQGSSNQNSSSANNSSGGTGGGNGNANSNGGGNACLDGTTNSGMNNLSLNNINMNSSVNPNLAMSCTASATGELKSKQQIGKNMSDMQLQPQAISTLKQNQTQQGKSGTSLNTTQQQHTSNQHSQSKHTGQQHQQQQHQQQQQQNLLNSNNNSSINQYAQNQINPNNSQNTASSTSSSLTGKVETNNLSSGAQNNQNSQNSQNSQNNQSHFLNKQLYHNSNYYNVNSSNNYNIPPGFNMTQEKEQNNNYLSNNVSSSNANSSVAAYRNNWNNINEKNLNHYSLNYNYNRSTKNNFNYTSNLNYSSSNGYNGTRDNTNNFFNYNSFNYALQTPPGLQNYYQNTQYQQQNSYSNRNYNYTGYNNNLSMWSREE
ncbi:conserved Plasmodium protein, unknown function [Plasmodium vivax]|uniref:Uncharacterized protein n=1 Tax=Plasmodium vivax TaxID=5855 RepID=A0A1G4HA04_PLAVI|nr:conserved Plasmodium protein, unknown function [Plasmodium vivax]